MSGKFSGLAEAVSALIEGETDVIAALANVSAAIAMFTDRINWAGFYLLKGETLVLGPFQGKPACARIQLRKGVCGTAAEKREILRVADVHLFPGHIACDENSRSEIVLPIFKSGAVFGVLDIDSPDLARFTEKDAEVFGNIAENLSEWITAL
ncbi:hypothetical protein FACS189490_08700 [Clostridia bacterium]|nr:hypothetical protein FACS189490_08700 [Clostridia bacterium]